MKTYRIYWKEKHCVDIEALSDDEALDKYIKGEFNSSKVRLIEIIDENAMPEEVKE